MGGIFFLSYKISELWELNSPNKLKIGVKAAYHDFSQTQQKWEFVRDFLNKILELPLIFYLSHISNEFQTYGLTLYPFLLGEELQFELELK